LPKGTRETLQTPQGSRGGEEFPERRHERYSVRSGIKHLKENVSIEDVTREYVEELKETGSNKMVGRCINPDHEDKTPSLVIYKETGSFTCFGCGIWGDVIDLEVYGGYHADLWTAMLALSMRYGVELPARPERWHKHNAEKHEDRERIARVLTESYQRRLHRIYAPLTLDGIEDSDERGRESTRIWEELRPVAQAMALRRLGGSS
jgi:DNA primase